MQPQSNSETVREDMDAQSRAYHKKFVVFESGVSITTSILQSVFPIEKKTSYPLKIERSPEEWATILFAS